MFILPQLGTKRKGTLSMMKQIKRLMLLFMLAVLMLTLCACHENPSQEQLYSKLFAHFESHGFTCRLEPVAQDREVPIYKASAWQKLMLDEEEVLVYFDDSNRADYLSTFVNEDVFGPAWRFGLRFVLVYNGSDGQLLKALNAIQND